MGEAGGNLDLKGHNLTITGSPGSASGQSVSLWSTTYPTDSVGGGGIQVNSGGTFDIDNLTPTWAGTVTLNGGSLVTHSGNSTLNNGVAASAGTTSYVGNTGSNGDLILNGNITGGGTISTVGNAWTVYLGGSNSGFTGTWNTTSEDTRFTSATAGSANAAWIAGRNLQTQISGGGTVSLGALTGSGTLQNALANTSTFSIGGLNTSTSFGGAIQNGSGTIALTKVGTGTLRSVAPTSPTPARPRSAAACCHCRTRPRSARPLPSGPPGH